MKKYFSTVLIKAFTKEAQNTFINNKLFKNYEEKEEVKIEEFFNEHYNTLRDESQLRKDFVSNYIKSLTPNEVNKLIDD